MKMTKDEQSQNVDFVRAIQRHRCLYNFNQTEHTKSDVESAWEQISKETKDTAVNCKMKWRNIRTVFLRYLKKNAHSTQWKSYYLMKEMRFLLPYVRPRSYSGVNDTLIKPELDAEESSDKLNTLVELSDIYSDTEREKPPSRQKRSPSAVSMDDPKYSPEPKRSKLSASIVEDASTSVAQNDPRMMFILSLYPDLHQMTDAQMRKFKKRVLDIVDELLDQ